MFLALIILSPCFLPILSEHNKKGDSLIFTNNKSLNFSTRLLTPFEPVDPTPKLRLLQIEYPHVLITSNKKNATTLSKSKYKLLRDLVKREDLSQNLSHRNGPAQMPKLKSNLKDYGESSHYRMKGESSQKGYYMNLLTKLLHKPRTSEKDQFNSAYALQKMSGSGWGWGGWGKGGGGHGHGGYGLDLLLCALSLLSLGGFLLNLLLNLMNLFGFGMVTSTQTYPVTVTQTQTATGGTATGGTATGGTLPATLPATYRDDLSAGSGFTGRTIDSMAGNGWGWPGSPAHFGLHIQLPHKGWTSTTTTTTESTLTLPTLTGLLFQGKDDVGVSGRIRRGFTVGGRKRPKRETFEPYVDPVTALEVFSKAVLNSINSAMNKYECMQIVVCENNKRARIIGQWLDYFMPVYSLSVSYIGHKIGAHNSLLDHIRAIVLGATETNCQTHFPRCEGDAMMEQKKF